MTVATRGARRFAALWLAVAALSASPAGASEPILGNLHYSSAIFYRVLPDWFIVGWLFGVRGDRDRSLQHIQTALALHPERIEYQVELGSQLLCRGTSRKDAAQLEWGREVLLEAVEREPKSLDDEREIEAAWIMLEAPRKSCGYSGDNWLEIDRKRARRAVKKTEKRVGKKIEK